MSYNCLNCRPAQNSGYNVHLQATSIPQCTGEKRLTIAMKDFCISRHYSQHSARHTEKLIWTITNSPPTATCDGIFLLTLPHCYINDLFDLFMYISLETALIWQTAFIPSLTCLCQMKWKLVWRKSDQDDASYKMMHNISSYTKIGTKIYTYQLCKLLCTI